MMIQYFKKLRLLPAVLMIGLATSCSAMLIGEGTTSSPGIGTDHRSAAQVAADDTSATALRSAYASDPMLRSEMLSVSVSSGVATLSGVVGSFDARDRALVVASKIAGLGRVNNQLQVNTHQ